MYESGSDKNLIKIVINKKSDEKREVKKKSVKYENIGNDGSEKMKVMKN